MSWIGRVRDGILSTGSSPRLSMCTVALKDGERCGLRSCRGTRQSWNWRGRCGNVEQRVYRTGSVCLLGETRLVYLCLSTQLDGLSVLISESYCLLLQAVDIIARQDAFVAKNSDSLANPDATVELFFLIIFRRLDGDLLEQLDDSLEILILEFTD